jgi:3-isopropylmalate/(R)-2-methylmalate dehydratase small subunit
MNPLDVVASRLVSLPEANIDTDQIIPARFLKVTDRSGLGEHLFEDLRRTPDGALREEFPLNQPSSRGASILLAGENFGCGSSREHAAWALAGAGFRVVMGRSFADIFHANARTNGILTVTLDQASANELTGVARRGEVVQVSLSRQEVRWEGGSCTFTVDPFAKLCLLQGKDPLGYILDHEDRIAAFEAEREGVE